MGIYYLFTFIFGLAIGSFLNVCIWRLPKGESVVSPPSHCTKCGTELKSIDLIPILSYLISRGRCRYCGDRYSAKYLFVELITAVTYVLLLFRYGLSVEFFASIFIISILIAVFFIDFEHKIIPNELVIIGIIGGAVLTVYNVFCSFSIYGDRHWWNPLLGAMTGSGFLFVVALIGFIIYKTDDAMGMGDVKIFAPIGMFLGWKLTIIALFLAIFLGGIISGILLAARLMDRKDAIPFGPFIVVGTFITLIWGTGILNWYMSNI